MEKNQKFISLWKQLTVGEQNDLLEKLLKESSFFVPDSEMNQGGQKNKMSINRVSLKN